MHIITIKDYTITYQRQGNDRNGNPIYIINVFQDGGNVNFKTDNRKDKYGNIKLTSYNIDDTINRLINSIE